jgi:hypothetical protein
MLLIVLTLVSNLSTIKYVLDVLDEDSYSILSDFENEKSDSDPSETEDDEISKLWHFSTTLSTISILGSIDNSALNNNFTHKLVLSDIQTKIFSPPEY